MDAGIRGLLRRALLAVAGLGCGASPFFFGYFDPSAWGPIALALIALALALLIARPAVPTGPAAAAIIALALFAAWSLLSMGWAESAERALTEGDRWVLYCVFLLVLVLLVFDARDAEVFLAAAVVGLLCVAGHDLAQMLSGDGPDLFGGSRLLEPLGYVNGLGGFFLLGFWPLAVLAERGRNPLLAGAAAGAASLLASLVLLTDSRGTVFAFVVSAAVILALLPGRNRRAWFLLVILAGLAAIWSPLTDVTAPLAAGHFAPPAETIEHGARAALLVAALVAVAWGLLSWAVDALRARPGSLSEALPRISAAALALAAIAAIVVGIAATGNPVHRVSDQYDAFTELKPVGSDTRFTSGGGNRYDYWRIAWAQFEDHPLDGVGAGNFDRTYFLERRTDEDVRQAHSIELGTLGETGLVGALALGAFFVAVFVGLWRRAAEARRSGTETGLTIAAAGIFLVWLAQTSVDWLHLIPGVTGLALGAAAILLLRPGGGARPLPVPLPVTLVAVALALVAIVLIGRPTLAEHLRSQAKGELESRPTAALKSAEESLSLNPDAVQGYYLEAAALARLGAYPPARAALEQAIRREPHNYVSWALLGDLTTRRGKIEEAMRAYRRAAELNPRDHGLRLLGSSRGLVVRLHRNPEVVTSLPAGEG